MKDFFNRETLDNIKQFCAENKKYVGVAGVLVGFILILIVVVAGGNNGRQSNTEAGLQTEISVKDFEFEKDYTNDAKDDISTLLADYYKAYVGDDIDTLGKLATPMSDNEKSYIGVVSQYYESVNDITPYTKNGLKKGSYFVSVKNSIKFTGVDTQAPTLDFFYIETGKDGKLFINNVYSNFNRTYCENELDDDIMELISKYTASSEFADLHEEVQKEYEQALKDAYSYEDEVVIEEYIKGREFSVAVVDGKAYPVIEIAPIQGFYDYKNKYQAGSTIETCPAELSPELTEKMQHYAEAGAKALFMEGYCRLDFMMKENGDMYCLEANTLPGMTPTSLIPQEARVLGIDYPTLCEKLIEVSLRKYQ